MKKIALLLLTLFVLNSCSFEGTEPNYFLEVLPVESFIVPEQFETNGTYEITVKYKRPSDCHFYEGIYYEKDGDNRIIGVQSRVLNDNDCLPLEDEPLEIKFDFVCTPGYTRYVFKFFKGHDTEGNNIFEEVEVPVTY